MLLFSINIPTYGIAIYSFFVGMSLSSYGYFIV